MRFSPHFLAELKARIPLDTLISRYVNLKHKTAGEHMGLCPFHNEKTPSFTVSTQKGFYHCFGCGAHGDHVTFLMEHTGLSYLDAVKDLANQAGMELPKEDPEMERKMRREASLHDVMQMAADYFKAQLQGQQGAMAREYIRNRAITPAAQERFQIGYAPDRRDGLRQHLNSKGVTDKTLEVCGLINQKPGSQPYDRFRGRLMFPIWDAAGKVIAFGGRILANDTNAPKYLNSPETELFHKGNMLYGFHLARKSSHQSGEMVVAEGYMDVVALYQAGISHAVAPMGTALTENQLKLLWQIVPEPTLCLDGDTAGKRAMAKAAELALPMLSPGASLKFSLLPEGMDPDDVLKTMGARALGQILAQSTSFSEALWNMTANQYPNQTPEQKAALEDALMKSAERIQHASLKQYYRRFFREKLWQAQSKKKSIKSHTPIKPAMIHVGPLEQNAAIMLALIIKKPELIDDAEVEDALHSTRWPSATYANTVDALCSFLQDGNRDFSTILHKSDTETLLRIAKVRSEDVHDITIAKRHFTFAQLSFQLAELHKEYESALAQTNHEETFEKLWELKKELDVMTLHVTREREAIAMLVEG